MEDSEKSVNTTEVRSTRKRVEKTPLPDTRAEETKETDSQTPHKGEPGDKITGTLENFKGIF